MQNPYLPARADDLQTYLCCSFFLIRLLRLTQGNPVSCNALSVQMQLGFLRSCAQYNHEPPFHYLNPFVLVEVKMNWCFNYTWNLSVKARVIIMSYRKCYILHKVSVFQTYQLVLMKMVLNPLYEADILVTFRVCIKVVTGTVDLIWSPPLFHFGFAIVVIYL